jgi:hypothetical protein
MHSTEIYITEANTVLCCLLTSSCQFLPVPARELVSGDHKLRLLTWFFVFGCSRPTQTLFNLLSLHPRLLSKAGVAK